MADYKFSVFHVQTLGVYVPIRPPAEPGGPSTGLFLEVERTLHQDGTWCEPTLRFNAAGVSGLTLAQLDVLRAAAGEAVEAFRRKYEVR